MMLSTLFFYCLFLFSVVAASNIGIFRDKTCSKSLDNYNGPNGYPDGTCTALHLEPMQSFSVVGLDPGCSVTIYGNNSDPELPCSSETKIVANLAQCYNSSWVYYSIDGCDVPSTLPSSSSTTLPPPTDTPPSTTPMPESRTPTGVVVGGVVGGVACFTMIVALLLYFLRRQYKKANPPSPLDRELPPPPSYNELSEEAARQELEYPKPAANRGNLELYAQESAAEMGRNSRYFPAAELEGDMLADFDNKGFNPVIRVHLV